MSSTKKHLYKTNRHDEDDPDPLMSPCFQISPDVELKDVPTTGEEFLLKVMKERENYAIVTKCSKDFSKFARNQSCFINEVKIFFFVNTVVVYNIYYHYLLILFILILASSR